MSSDWYGTFNERCATIIRGWAPIIQGDDYAENSAGGFVEGHKYMFTLTPIEAYSLAMAQVSVGPPLQLTAADTIALVPQIVEFRYVEFQVPVADSG